MKYASFGQRFVGHVLDNVIMLGVIIAGALMFSAGPIGILLGLGAIGGYIFYNYVYRVSKKGTTLGKKYAGLKIVDKDNKNLPMGKAFLRMLVKDACFLFSIIGALAYSIPIFNNKKSQSLGDMAAGSYVTEA